MTTYLTYETIDQLTGEARSGYDGRVARELDEWSRWSRGATEWLRCGKADIHHLLRSLLADFPHRRHSVMQVVEDREKHEAARLKQRIQIARAPGHP